MNLRLILLCLRHPRSWRHCVSDAAKTAPKVVEWRDQRLASIEAKRQELRTMPSDPITGAVMGTQTRQRGGE